MVSSHPGVLVMGRLRQKAIAHAPLAFRLASVHALALSVYQASAEAHMGCDSTVRLVVNSIRHIVFSIILDVLGHRLQVRKRRKLLLFFVILIVVGILGSVHHALILLLVHLTVHEFLLI